VTYTAEFGGIHIFRLAYLVAGAPLVWLHSMPNCSYPGSSPYPIQGYFASFDSSENIVFMGKDNDMWRLYLVGGHDWQSENLNAASAAPPPQKRSLYTPPTAYAFNRARSHHVNYFCDGHVYELWNNGQWRFNDLTIASGAPSSATPDPSTSPNGYEFNAYSSQHVVYRSQDGNIRELWGDGSGWHHNDLTLAAGAHDQSTCGPCGYMFEGQGTQHVVYRSSLGQIHELWWDTSGWHFNNVTAEAAGGHADNQRRPIPMVANQQHVVYVGADGVLRDACRKGDHWILQNLSDSVGLPIGDPCGCPFKTNLGFVACRGQNNHIYMLSLGATGFGYSSDLTAISGAPASAAPAASPVAYAYNPTGTMLGENVVYCSADGHVHLIYYGASWATAGWHHLDLTVTTGAPLSAVSVPAAYSSNVDLTQDVIYLGQDQHLHHLQWRADVWRNAGDLTALTNAPAASPVGPLSAYCFDTDGTQHVLYRGTDDHLHALHYSSGSWMHKDFTTASGTPSITGFPVGFASNSLNSQHIFAIAQNGDVWEHYSVGPDWYNTDKTDRFPPLTLAQSQLELQSHDLGRRDISQPRKRGRG
jgi:hypothetical protein